MVVGGSWGKLRREPAPVREEWGFAGPFRPGCPTGLTLPGEVTEERPRAASSMKARSQPRIP